MYSETGIFTVAIKAERAVFERTRARFVRMHYTL